MSNLCSSKRSPPASFKYQYSVYHRMPICETEREESNDSPLSKIPIALEIRIVRKSYNEVCITRSARCLVISFFCIVTMKSVNTLFHGYIVPKVRLVLSAFVLTVKVPFGSVTFRPLSKCLHGVVVVWPVAEPEISVIFHPDAKVNIDVGYVFSPQMLPGFTRYN